MSFINREDAIKELMSWLPKLENGLIHWTGIKAMLENLPDADDGWIPVEERLPDKYGWYLCTLKDGRVNCYYWNNKGEWLDNGKKHFFELYHVYSKLTGMEVLAKNEESVYWTDWVIAWRPLPKPYKPKEEQV